MRCVFWFLFCVKVQMVMVCADIILLRSEFNKVEGMAHLTLNF